MVGVPSEERLTLEVPDDLAGVRADRVVAQLSGLTRRATQDLIDRGLVVVAGAPVGRRDQLPAGTVVEVTVPAIDETLQPEPIDFEVVYEDGDLAVIDKPAGIVVHPGAGNPTGTLVHGLLYRWPEVRGVGQPGRWGVVHRLDRETSGLLAVAKSHEGYLGLMSLVADRAMTRRYLTLVHGELELPTGTIDAPLGRDTRHPTRIRVSADGRPAVTHYELREQFPGYALLQVTLATGRTHQIRVHLASIGLAVVGDRAYGRPGRPEVDPGRVWLHASDLAFEHPLTGTAVAAHAPLPPELARSLSVLRADG